MNKPNLVKELKKVRKMLVEKSIKNTGKTDYIIAISDFDEVFDTTLKNAARSKSNR